MRPDDAERLRELVNSERAPSTDERAFLAELVRKAARLGTADWALARIEATMVLNRQEATR